MLKREFLRKGEQTKAVPREGLHLKLYDTVPRLFILVTLPKIHLS